MTDKVWTREALTEQILKDTAGMWRHIDDSSMARRGRQRSASELLGAVKGGCALLQEDCLGDTKDLLTLAVGILDLIRAIVLEEQAKAGSS